GGIAGVFELDDVPAVLGLHGFGRDLALLQSLDRIAERLDHARRREPTEIAALSLRIVAGFGLRDVFELRPSLELLDELFGLLLGRYQDVRGVVLGLVGGGIVLGVQFLVRGFVALHVFLCGGVGQNLGAQQRQAGRDLGVLVQPFLLADRRDELHVDHLMQHLILLFGGDIGTRLAAQQSLEIIVVGVARYGRAVHDGNRR